MTWCRVLLVPLALAGLASHAPAAGPGIFSHKPKYNPAERVPELLIQLKTGRDEAQRTAATEELRQYDPKAFPEIIPALIDVLGRDTSTAVRAEAAESLGKLRPIAQKVGYALEQAVSNDSSMRVRLSARQALWQYHLVGYRSGRPTEPPTAAGDAMVSAPPGPSTPATAMQRPATVVRTGQAPSGTPRETAEPPLADSPAVVNIGPPAVPATPVSRPQTSAKIPFQLIPVTPQPKPAPAAPAPKADSTPPAVKPSADGPALPPPG